MKRDEAKNNDLGLYVATALVTFVAAFGVSGGTNLWMMVTNNELIKEYRPTLTFRSAWIGDGIILPLVNVLIMKALVKWKPKVEAGTLVMPVIGGLALTLLFHIVQARNGLVNWTMPKPWEWNLLGYYHFVFMATQFTYMFFYLTQLAGHWGQGQVTTDQKRDLAIIAACMAGFGALLYTDYY